jgi:hypothetical protein
MTTEDPRDPDLDALVDALLQAHAAQSVDDYSVRGRRLAAVGCQELQERYEQAYKAWAGDPHNRDKSRDASDVSAEFTLRNQSPPSEAIRKEIEALNAAAKRVLRRMRDNPALQEAWEREYEPLASMLLDDPKAKH